MLLSPRKSIMPPKLSSRMSYLVTEDDLLSNDLNASSNFKKNRRGSWVNIAKTS